MLKGLGDMNAMMQKAMSMQKEIQRVQKELKKKIVEAEVGGGMVKVIMNGHLEVIDVKIDVSKTDMNDAAMIEDLVVSGVNEAIKKAKETAKESMAGITAGINIPGLNLE